MTPRQVAREDSLKTAGDWRQAALVRECRPALSLPDTGKLAYLSVTAHHVDNNLKCVHFCWICASHSSSLFTNNVQFVQRLCQLIVHIGLKGAGCWRSVTRSINDGLVVCIKLGTGLELSCCQWQAVWPHPCPSEQTLHSPRVVLLSMTGSLTASFLSEQTLNSPRVVLLSMTGSLTASLSVWTNSTQS